METYKDNSYFMEQVEKKELFAVKSSIVNMMQRMNGNKEKIKKAIEYAKQKGAFNWEEHDNDETKYKFQTPMENYNFEKGRLVQNFSKIRYERVMDLLSEVLKERNISITEDPGEEPTQISATKKNDIIKKLQQQLFVVTATIVVLIVVAVVGWLLIRK